MKLSCHTISVPDYPNAGETLLYNTRSQALVKLNKGISELSVTEQKQLHQMGIMVENDQEDLVRLKAHMDQLKYAVNERVLYTTILTTYACNLKCVYCFEESSRVNERMSMENAQHTMHWLKAKVLKFGYRSLYLNFYGGEPLLNKPVLEHIAACMKDWCEGQGIRFKFMMQTNGYLMTPEIIDRYLPLNLAQVRISVDGVGKDHDQNRPLRGGGGTFEVIMRNIVASCHKVPIGLSVSFDHGDVSHIERLLEYCAQKGIIHQLGQFLFSPVQATLGAKGEMEKIRNHHCNSNFENDALVAANSRITELMAQYGLQHKSSLSTSICPVTSDESGDTIDQQGRIFRCNTMLGHPELSIGHVRNNDYNPQHQTFLHLDVYNQCPQDCTYMPMCSGGCRLASFLKNQNFKTPACHKPYLNKMAAGIIMQEYERRTNQQIAAAVR